MWQPAQRFVLHSDARRWLAGICAGTLDPCSLWCMQLANEASIARYISTAPGQLNMVTAGVEKPTWQQPKHLGFSMQSWATAVCYIQPMVSSENMFLWHKQPSVQIHRGINQDCRVDCGQRSLATKRMQITVENAEHWPRLSVRLLIAWTLVSLMDRSVLKWSSVSAPISKDRPARSTTRFLFSPFDHNISVSDNIICTRWDYLPSSAEVMSCIKWSHPWLW